MDRWTLARDVEIKVDPPFVEEEQVTEEIRFEDGEWEREEGVHDFGAVCEVLLDVGVAREVGHEFGCMGGVYVEAGINPCSRLLGHASRPKLVPYLLWERCRGGCSLGSGCCRLRRRGWDRDANCLFVGDRPDVRREVEDEDQGNEGNNVGRLERRAPV